MTKNRLLWLVVAILASLTVYRYYKSKLVEDITIPNVMVHEISVLDEKMFLFEMIPHHVEAIEVSNDLLKKVSNPKLKAFMEKLIEVQSKEVADMKIWHMNWFGVAYDDNAGYKPMMGDLKNYTGRDLEKVYIEGMIFHHKGAVEMAKSILRQEIRPEIKKLAESIISSQESEIALLTSWLTEKYSDIEAKDPVQHQMGTH